MGKSLSGKELGPGYSQRKDGLYTRSFRENGKQKAVYGATLRECKAKYEARMIEAKQGISSENPTVNAIWLAFLEKKISVGKLRGSTAALYKAEYEKYISSEFGKMRVKAVKTLEIEVFQQKLVKKGLATGSINNVMALLRQILETATKSGYIPRNPVEGIEEIKDDGKTNRQNNRALEQDELNLFMEYAANNFYYHAIRFLVCTGIRSGELRALRWSDVDGKNNVIHIRKTVSHDENYHPCINDPKTSQSNRDFPLNSQILEILRDQRQLCRRYFDNNIKKIDDFIFPSSTGEMLSKSVLCRNFQKICDNINAGNHDFKAVSPHALRHTFITQALLSGMNEYVVKSLVGHSQATRVTTTTYLGRSQTAMQEAMQNFKIG